MHSTLRYLDLSLGVRIPTEASQAQGLAKGVVADFDNPTCTKQGPLEANRSKHRAKRFISSTMSSSNRPESACAVSSTTLDPVLRNTLRYTISAKEYKLLHDYLIKRSPASIQKRALPPPKYDVIAPAKDDYNPAAVRAAVRVFIATGTGLKLWEIVSTQIISRGKSK